MSAFVGPNAGSMQGTPDLSFSVAQLAALSRSKMLLSSTTDGSRQSQRFVKQPVMGESPPGALGSFVLAPLFSVAKNTVKTVPSAKIGSAPLRHVYLLLRRARRRCRLGFSFPTSNQTGGR